MDSDHGGDSDGEGMRRGAHGLGAAGDAGAASDGRGGGATSDGEGFAAPPAAPTDGGEDDVRARIEREEERVMEDITCYRILCPRPEMKEAAAKAEKGEGDEPLDDSKKVPYFDLFRFADKVDYALLAAALVAAAGNGAAMPLFSLIFGEMVDSFNTPDFTDRMDGVSLWFLYLGILALGCSIIQVAFVIISSERQILRVREAYVAALLRQDISWFDLNKPGEVASRIAEDTIVMQNGMGEKLTNAFQHICTFLTGTILGFVNGWDMSLIIVAFLPIIVLPMATLKVAKAVFTKVEQDAYARSGAAASEAFGAVRTVAAFGGEEAESARYNRYIGRTEVVVIRSGRAVGLAVGLLWMGLMGSYAAALYYGATKIIRSREDKPECALVITADGCFTGGDVMQVFFAVLMGAMSIGQAGPNFTAFAQAQGAAYRIFAVLDAIPTVDTTFARELGLQREQRIRAITATASDGTAAVKPTSAPTTTTTTTVASPSAVTVVAPGTAAPHAKDEADDEAEESRAAAATALAAGAASLAPATMITRPLSASVGFTPTTKARGHIEFRNVSFAYPSRMSVLVLKNFNLTIEPGQQVALVGPSGSGKSTIIQLLLRFYDPLEGEVLLDGRPIREYNVQWLRAQFGLVSQEPTLFGTTVAENIVYGLPGYSRSDFSTDGEGRVRLPAEIMALVQEAAVTASADGFVARLVNGYQTRVGEKGGQLSGGQKQRIAIARAMIRKPGILLLDEATSALDTESERQVQAAIDTLLRREGDQITSVVIAHRLSTIVDANVIVVLDQGRIVELGNNETLMQRQGLFYNLRQQQDLSARQHASALTSAGGAAAVPALADAPATEVAEGGGGGDSARTTEGVALSETAADPAASAAATTATAAATTEVDVVARARAPSTGAAAGGAAEDASVDNDILALRFAVHYILPDGRRMTEMEIARSPDLAELALASSPSPTSSSAAAPTAGGANGANGASVPPTPLLPHSPEVQMMWRSVATFAANEKRAFLKWWTGVDAMPTGGWESLPQRPVLAHPSSLDKNSKEFAEFRKLVAAAIANATADDEDDDAEDDEETAAAAKAAGSRLLKATSRKGAATAGSAAAAAGTGASEPATPAAAAGGSPGGLSAGATPKPKAEGGDASSPSKKGKKKKGKKSKPLAVLLASPTKPYAFLGTLVLPSTVHSQPRLTAQLLRACAQAVPFSRVYHYQQGDWWAFALAILGAMVNGCVFPVYAIVLSEMITVLYRPLNEDLRSGASDYAWGFVGIGVASLIFHVIQLSSIEYAGAKLTRRLRAATYHATLRQEIGYFDAEENATGRLSARLATDATLVRATTGERLAIGVQTATTMLAGIIISFTASWRLSLIMLAIVPLMVITGVFQMKMMMGFTESNKEALESSGQVAQEAMIGIRTVQAFGLQEHILRAFHDAIKHITKHGITTGLLSGFSMGVSMFILFCAYALVFWVGSRFIADGDLEFTQMNRVFFALAFAATGAGQQSALSADQGKAMMAAKSIFAILDRRSKIDPLSSKGEKPAQFRGHIEFRNVSFAYPARPDTLVLKNFNVTIEPGQHVALVGPSGSGKSTIIQLLMRFYDPQEGEILLDDVPLRNYNVQWLRAQFGLVSQEPTLFTDTIQYNILYGAVGRKPEPDLGRVTDVDSRDHPEVVQAAKAASAERFIHNFPRRFATLVGTVSSSQLSGGQKQRVAIARAIIRNPRVLLLDEATSALDTESERQVQRALDRIFAETRKRDAAHRQTSIVIAHRLSTIKNADKIVVMKDGAFVEQGTHDDLVNRPDSLYARLARAQGAAATAVAAAATDA